MVGPVPADLRRKYFMRSRDRDSNLLRVVPELRQLVEFRRLNFMDADFGLSQKADVIFCRNVIIYFDRPTQEQILQKLAAQLVPGGLRLRRATPRPCTTWMSRWCRWRRPSTGKPMLELESEVSEVYLHPGESYLARKPAIIRTILGSCVGVTFWSARLGVGALCHALLPRCPANSSIGLSLANGHRYVDFSIRDLARQFDELGRASHGGASQAVWRRRCAPGQRYGVRRNPRSAN